MAPGDKTVEVDYGQHDLEGTNLGKTDPRTKPFNPLDKNDQDKVSIDQAPINDLEDLPA